MKLTKIYSNSSTFKEVIFNDHLNIVLGSIKNPEKFDNDSHNLGKTTLISLIDFLLLKEIDKSHFLKDPTFQNDIFFLEIYLNNGESLTIKRSVEQNTRISIKIHGERYMNFVNESNWDYQDYRLTSKDILKNPKHILNSLINLKIDENTYFYRDIIAYFTRNQNDYTDIFKLSKHQGKDIDWKPSLFTLLGFNGAYLKKKYVLEQEINSKEDLIKKIEKEFSVDSNEKEKIKNLITLKDQKINELRKQMDTFDFIKSENSDLESLVTNIEKEISDLNTRKYKLFTEIKRIRESLNQKVDFDYKKVFSLFEEVSILFNEKLKKDYEDLIEFNTLLTKDRSKYLIINLEQKQKQIIEIDSMLSNLSSERKRKLSYLGTTDNFKKYKDLQLKLIDLEKEKENMLTKIEYADQMKQSQSQINKMKSDLSLLVDEIDTIISNSNSYFDTIRNKYISFLKQVINKDAILYLSQNLNGNVDFKSSVLNEDKETKEGDGNTYKKIMCASFDIAILDTYIDKDFIKFVIHDGVFESLEGRRKTSYLNFIKSITTSSNIQYIFTAIEEDLDSQFLIENKDAVCVILSDDDEYKGSLFGKRF